MRSLEQIVADNGGDNTPGLDTHNLTGRVAPEGVEPEWTPLEADDTDDAWYEARIGYYEDMCGTCGANMPADGHYPSCERNAWGVDELLDCE